MAYVIKILGYADGRTCSIAGGYVKNFDVDGANGLGVVLVTHDVEEAWRFENNTEAFQLWNKQSTVKPIRSDGMPNKPLTAYTVELLYVHD